MAAGRGLVPLTLLLLLAACAHDRWPGEREDPAPCLLVLGIAQDAGVPQAGTKSHPGFEDPQERRFATSLALVHGERRWLVEATPDLEEQLWRLDRFRPVAGTPGLAGVIVTHAHLGHYLGLAMFGHEAMGARGLPLHVMPRMAAFLRDNGPWSMLVARGNVVLHELAAGRETALDEAITIEPLPVPHRDEYSETVGFLVRGPRRRVLFLPDNDDWGAWEAAGGDLEGLLAQVDLAYVDGTFFADGEIPGRDMSGFPHPRIRDTMSRLAGLPAAERGKLRFIHLNHTNPALEPDGAARREIEARGFAVAEEGEVEEL